jgi:hypothetical protein
MIITILIILGFLIIIGHMIYQTKRIRVVQEVRNHHLLKDDYIVETKIKRGYSTLEEMTVYNVPESEIQRILEEQRQWACVQLPTIKEKLKRKILFEKEIKCR